MTSYSYMYVQSENLWKGWKQMEAVTFNALKVNNKENQKRKVLKLQWVWRHFRPNAFSRLYISFFIVYFCATNDPIIFSDTYYKHF